MMGRRNEHGRSAMHRSRLSTLVIYCAEAEFERSVDFWSGDFESGATTW